MHRSLLPISKNVKTSSTILQHTFLYLLHGLIFTSQLHSCLRYLYSCIIAGSYHHFNFALFILLCNVSKPMSPLTASLQVLEEHTIICLPPSNIGFKEPVYLFLSFHTSLPYCVLGLITDKEKSTKMQALNAI